ncbi:hypothetical protein JCM5296_003121 [Sporobolomyces johnsonii]
MAEREPARTSSSSINGMIREAKGLALELKGMLKHKSPWDREVEFQREALRKAYLRVIFSPPSSSSSAQRISTSDVPSLGAPLKARSSSVSTSHTALILERLNVLWLDTSHALIQIYRHRLSELDKAIAEAPRAHKGKNRRGGNGGDIQLPPAPGPVARRKLLHSFRQFLGAEEEFWRTLCGRLASRLYPEEADELRGLGIIASAFSATSEDDAGDAEPRTEEQKKALRTGVLPLAHKALICFGDLARYSELYSDGSGTGTAALKERGGKRGGKQGGGAERKVKTFTKAAECYYQARLLIPDNGNPSNQLAVLAQYAADPLSSAYHYYRALSVRTPFDTARANLQTTFKKVLQRWFSPDGGEPEGDDGVKFKAAFVAIQGIFFTKQRLADLPALSLRVHELFRGAIEERLLTSDVVAKVLVTSLSSLWHARMNRPSSSDSKAAISRSKSSSAAVAVPSTSEADRIKIEPHILLHILSLYTILLSTGSAETNDLYTANLSAAAADEPVPLAQNISAVLRRSLPALRIMSKWLMGQLEYISRVEARVKARERKRTRPSTGTEEEAQRASLDSEADGAPVLTVAELQQVLDNLWIAFADFSNSMKLAFPLAELPSLLDEGVWLEEDVDMLGFAPLRRGMKEGVMKGQEGGARPREIRRVGRDVHPNEEQLMRIADGQRDAALLADSPNSRIALVDGAFVFTSRDDQPSEDESPEALEAREVALAARRLSNAFDVPPPRVLETFTAARALDLDDDSEMAYQATEDDPVDRAMRIDAADKVDMEGLEDDEEDDDDEQIVYPGNRSTSQPPTAPPGLTRPIASLFGTPSGSPIPARTAADLRQHLLSGGSPASLPSSTSYVSPALLAPLPGGSPSSPAGPSIWAPSAEFGASLLQPQPQHQPVTPRSFEAIPNLTHGSSAAHAAGWTHAQQMAYPALPMQQHTSAPALFGGSPAFAPPASSSPHRGPPPPPGLVPSPSHAGLASHLSRTPASFSHPVPQPHPQHPQPHPQQTSDLSPFASPFGGSVQQPQGYPQTGGWPPTHGGRGFG